MHAIKEDHSPRDLHWGSIDWSPSPPITSRKGAKSRRPTGAVQGHYTRIKLNKIDWIVWAACIANRPEGGGPDISLLCRAIRTGATDLAFERATLQSAVALRIVTTQPYDQPRRNVSEVTLRCQRRRCGSGVSLGCRAKDRALRIWIVTVLPCPPLGRCGYGVSVRRCAIGTSTSTMDLKCCYAVV